MLSLQRTGVAGAQEGLVKRDGRALEPLDALLALEGLLGQSRQVVVGDVDRRLSAVIGDP